ncbi:MAG: carbamoyltransferase HypF [Candidatus Eremiobacteraeota bacterium]|nr:carbamoyltransferase HypF [Candidatus Eremiobacteraeota bacterium]MBC5803760.1 carbamoyltransferase HypF [Candidatus Eremiobacteraeota bacterium]MBC5821832.1 carbamoyltransferase HypF [Candidatus Eremiobacteraeota bacterium]
MVQGVGFRPFTHRLAHRYAISGWVKNGGDGVEIFAEGTIGALDAFADALLSEAPPAARIASTDVADARCEGLAEFEIRESRPSSRPTVRIAPDLAACDACLRELFDPADRRYRYPYINCTDCGPRYSIVTSLPYDRAGTTMAAWPMCDFCAAEYHDPANRRFHAQPVACPVCGPTYVLWASAAAEVRGHDAIVAAATMLRAGSIVAVKGIGGYHLACDARNADAVAALRERKFRKERPFALMARDLATARTLVAPDDDAFDAALLSTARPIVLAPARAVFAGVAPDNRELGVMLPYAPLHHLLFAAGAPDVLVLTSANRSSEPIAYDDADARRSLAGIADAFLVGDRPIARRLDDSVVRISAGAPAILRRGRGYAPMAVATVPSTRPLLALGGDLKNALALVVDGQVFASQHIGDLDHRSAREACIATIRDLCAIYAVRPAELLVVHDAHPEYVSTALAGELGAPAIAVQHHRAHVASVIAERGAWTTPLLGVAFDGTGYGDDGTIWGGEFFTGTVKDGFERVAHLRRAQLPGGDAAARFPVAAAAGFLAELDDLPDLTQAPFSLGERYAAARELIAHDVRCFATTSLGRLFDTVAALLGFTRPMSFEGQAAMWLEHLAAAASPAGRPTYAFPFTAQELDYRPLLRAIVADRAAAREATQIAAAFHVAVADGVTAVSQRYGDVPVVCSGGVFQNGLLVELLRERLGARAWFNASVPANDGGLALGQAGLGAFASGPASF